MGLSSATRDDPFVQGGYQGLFYAPGAPKATTTTSSATENDAPLSYFSARPTPVDRPCKGVYFKGHAPLSVYPGPDHRLSPKNSIPGPPPSQQKTRTKNFSAACQSVVLRQAEVSNEAFWGKGNQSRSKLRVHPNIQTSAKSGKAGKYEGRP